MAHLQIDSDNKLPWRRPQPGESVELLSQARDFIDHALKLCQDHESKLITEITDPHHARYTLAQAVDTADHDLLYNLPTQPDPLWNPTPSNPTRTRILCPPERASTLDHPTANTEIRVAAHPGTNFAIIDRHTALIHTPANRHKLLILRHPSLVNLVTGLLNHIWRTAEPLTHHTATLAARRNCHTTHQILRELAHGSTDDAAARRLSMSVRTFRRHVADIMRDIDARSRFQAGIRLAQLGLAPPPHDLQDDDLAS
jgi:DNA-binding CsgD family transcriptional regulator